MSSWDYKYYLHYTDSQATPKRIGSDDLIFLVELGSGLLESGAHHATISTYKWPEPSDQFGRKPYCEDMTTIPYRDYCK